MEKLKYYIWLTRLKGVGPVTQRLLVERFGSPYGVYLAGTEGIGQVDGISDAVIKAVSEDVRLGKALCEAELILYDCYDKGIEVVTIEDPRYPLEVSQDRKMPILLYYKGTLREESMGVAIVGARRCSEYGKRVACEAAQCLAENNVPVISGMAKGIDGYAHTACIKSGGYTLAFMGGGVDVCYPSEQRTLYEKIAECGAVVSEYPPGTRPFHRNFARRNYLIGAWSKKVLVVQAGEKSGALITACFAMKSGKSVLSAPDRIYEGCSAGSNMLIQKGARIYLGREQLLEGIENICKGDMGEELTADTDSCRVGAGKNDFVNDGLSNLERHILRLIDEEPRTLHEILRLCPCGCRLDSVEEALFSLELDMKIEQRGGFFHSKRA